MRSTSQKNRTSSFVLSAGALTQFLAAVACFLGAFVLPLSFAEFRGASRNVLLILGCGMLLLSVVNVVFGRQLNRFMARAGKRSRVVVPREGIAYLAIMLTLAVGALLGHRNMPLLVFGMMAGAFILNGWMVYCMLKGISVQRCVADRASVGDSVIVELTVRNDKKWLASHLLEVCDQISGDGLTKQDRDIEGIVTFVRIPPGEDRTGRYEVRFHARGRYRFGPARISSRFPLGIGERGQLTTTTAELIVHPEIGLLLPAWHRQQKELAESTPRVHSRPGLFDDEFLRIREWREDDNPRAIHWRSTARRGQLMVRECQQNRQADSLILLDLPDLPEWSHEESEAAISLAATICHDQTCASSGSEFVLGIAADRLMVIAGRFPAGFREEALDALAVCQRSVRASLPDLLTAVLAEHTLTDNRLILITPRPQEAERVLQDLTETVCDNRIDLLTQFAIITASAADMSTVYSVPGLTNDFGMKSARRSEETDR